MKLEPEHAAELYARYKAVAEAGDAVALKPRTPPVATDKAIVANEATQQ